MFTLSIEEIIVIDLIAVDYDLHVFFRVNADLPKLQLVTEILLQTTNPDLSHFETKLH